MKKRKVNKEELKLIIDPVGEFYVPLNLGKNSTTKVAFAGEDITISISGDTITINLWDWFMAQRDKLRKKK